MSTVDPSARQAWRDGRPLSLTMAEFVLLEAFLRHAGQVLSRERLAEQVLGRRLALVRSQHRRARQQPAEETRRRRRCAANTFAPCAAKATCSSASIRTVSEHAEPVSQDLPVVLDHADRHRRGVRDAGVDARAGTGGASDGLASRLGSRAAGLWSDLLPAHAIPDRPRPATARRGPATGGRRLDGARERRAATSRRDRRAGPRLQLHGGARRGARHESTAADLRHLA